MVLTLQYGGVTSSPDGRVAVDIWWSRVIITGACHSLLSPLLVIPCSPPMFYLSLAGAVTWWLTQGPSVSMWVSPPTGHTLPPLSGLPAADTDVTPVWSSGRALQSLLASDGGRHRRPSDGRSAGYQTPAQSGHFWGFLQLHSSPLAMSVVHSVVTQRGQTRPGSGSDIMYTVWAGLGLHNDRLQNSANAPNKKIRTQFRRSGPGPPQRVSGG